MKTPSISDMLAFDPIDTAERIMGRGSDDATKLGMLLAMDHGRKKLAMLESLDDTTFANTVERYLRITGEMGFEEVLRLPFKGRAWDDGPAPDEAMFILAHRDGLLLKFDTYQTKDVNGASVYYNWQPNPGVDHWRVTSSGQYFDYDADTGRGTWAGDHDAREALRHKIQRLRDNGRFLSRWKQRPFMWLLHHMDTKEEGYDHDAINAERIGRLPDWVRTMITPEENT